jgi:sigma-B regulation protein RsbU (phosphoserine phosphatase)
MNLNYLSKFNPTSLQQRATLFILLPTLAILLTMGFMSMLLIRQALLEQWQETAIAKLQQAAHHIDMRLLLPKNALKLFREEEGIEIDRHIAQFIVAQLREMEGVIQVNLEWKGDRINDAFMGGGMSMPHMNFSRMKGLDVSTPIYNSEFKNETVSLVTEFWNDNNQKLGHIEVIISFYDLIGQIVKTPWWKSNKAFLVDSQGNILTQTELFKDIREKRKGNLFGQNNSLEQKTLAALRENRSGTIFGPGMPPDEISGYYHLNEAPWTMVIIAQGEKVLQPIMKFRYSYFFISAAGITLALLLIRITTNKTTRAIRRLSKGANDLAANTFGTELQITSRDEVGELTRNFNTMSKRLQERLRLQEAMNIAREVQQNLLPQNSYTTEGIDICGITLYCDETGGDYFDLLPHPGQQNKVHIIAGDVVGHGIGAAIMMATIRALVRCRISHSGGPAAIMGDVNRLLCRDTLKSGNFITLFYLVVNTTTNKLEWVRCGHDPAIVYSPGNHSFSELKGKGLALGVDPSWEYQENNLPLDHGPQIIVIGSDGVWDTENEDEERFGREKVKTVLAENSHLSSKGIVAAMTDEINHFRNTKPLTDDITLVITKIG